MIKTIIIDDECHAIEGLIWELENFKDTIEVVGKFTHPKRAIKFIEEEKVDCVFLDIEMPSMDGFQFLKMFPKRNFEVVITTAYNEYGIKALKEKAIDYLTKPIDSDDLQKTVERLTEVFSKKQNNNLIEGIDNFEKILTDFNKKFKRPKITFNTNGKLLFYTPDEIIFVESDGNYSSIHLVDGKKLVLTKKIKEVDAMLPDEDFFRVHNSYIINLDKVKEFYKTDAYVILEGNHKIPVSRQKRPKFLDMI